MAMDHEDFDDVTLFAPQRNKRPPAADPTEFNAASSGKNGTHKRAKVEAVETEDAEPFRALGLSKWQTAVCRSLGIVQPTPVQTGCIPAILQGRDVIACALTGSGKTAAFALPMLQQLAQNPFGVFGLVLAPTRELACQLADQFKAFGAGITLKVVVIIGGLDVQTQSKALAARPHIVIATPGRLRDLISNNQQLAAAFSRARFLVLDEADRLLDPSFESELLCIAGALPSERQTLLFSATMTRSLVDMQSSVLKDAHCYQEYQGLSTPHPLTEQYILIPSKVKEVYLAYVLTTHLAATKARSAMIFCSTCKGCRNLAYVLDELGTECAALHSHQSQGRRLAALDKFRSGRVKLLLATDVASRGLDIPAVDAVLNYDLPMLARDYVHRVGRTARAGRPGWALSFVTQYDVELVHQIEELVGHQLSALELDEKEVLKDISKVFKAHRKAVMQAAEHEQAQEQRGRPQKSNQNKKKKQRVSTPYEGPSISAFIR
ncbi:hypothetical protein WJX73_007408 [Symbiochloris irregularis]|uniref:Uncharacterized protein n=1 Tax=Symbiochloris irregularis TaxID=706552 RepID=A0AAW1P016_9CHLO